MSQRLLLLLQAVEPPAPLAQGPTLFDTRSVVTVVVVVTVLAVAAWWLRRQAPLRTRRHQIRVDTAVPLGERRSLVVVTVEGRRLLLGMTPSHVGLVTELGPAAPSFDAAVESALQTNAGTEGQS